MPYYNRDPKRDDDFDNHPYASFMVEGLGRALWATLGLRALGLGALGAWGYGFRLSSSTAAQKIQTL